jgi:type IV pilus assembly protein PilC
MEASSETNVIRSLKENGFIATRIEEKQEETPFLQRKVPLKELALVCRQLSAMIRTGVPIIQAIRTVKEQIKNKKLHEILDSVSRDIANGDTVAEAFNKHQRYFPTLFNKLLYAAEVSGELDKVLYTLSESFQKDIKIRSKLRSAFTYPVFILVFAFIMVTALIVFVLPTFVNLFGNTDLPFITKMLMGTNQFLSKNGLYVLIAIGVLVFLAINWGKSKDGRKQIDYFLCRLPIFGDLVRKNVTFRFSQTLHDLHSSGVLIEKSLQIVSEVVNNAYYQKEIEKVREEVMEGSDIASALQRSGIFPYTLISMIRIGEESGELDILLKDVSEYSQNELEQRISEVTSFIEPLLLIIVGVFVGLAIIGILLPMYDGMMSV